MSEGIRQKLEGARIYVLVGVVCLASFCLLFLRDWDVPPAFPSKFWNALAAFAILGIVSDSFAFRIPFAKVATSVGFIPFIASVVLFRHPWPMVVAGVTGVVVDTLVRHRPAVKVWFNTAQYMLATGLASLVYARLGGPISLEGFDFAPVRMPRRNLLCCESRQRGSRRIVEQRCVRTRSMGPNRQRRLCHRLALQHARHTPCLLVCEAAAPWPGDPDLSAIPSSPAVPNELAASGGA